MKAEAHIKAHIKALTPKMARVAKYTLADKDLVDNVVQDTIVALWEKCYAQKKLDKIEGCRFQTKTQHLIAKINKILHMGV